MGRRVNIRKAEGVQRQLGGQARKVHGCHASLFNLFGKTTEVTFLNTLDEKESNQVGGGGCFSFDSNDKENRCHHFIAVVSDVSKL